MLYECTSIPWPLSASLMHRSTAKMDYSPILTNEISGGIFSYIQGMRGNKMLMFFNEWKNKILSKINPFKREILWFIE